MDDPLPAGIIPAPIPSVTETWFLCAGRIIDRGLIAVKETGTAGIALFRENHRNPHQLRLVGEQLDKPGTRDLHKGLVIALAHLHFLLPERVLANNQQADSLLYQQVNHPTA